MSPISPNGTSASCGGSVDVEPHVDAEAWLPDLSRAPPVTSTGRAGGQQGAVCRDFQSLVPAVSGGPPVAVAALLAVVRPTLLRPLVGAFRRLCAPCLCERCGLRGEVVVDPALPARSGPVGRGSQPVWAASVRADLGIVGPASESAASLCIEGYATLVACPVRGILPPSLALLLRAPRVLQAERREALWSCR